MRRAFPLGTASASIVYGQYGKLFQRQISNVVKLSFSDGIIRGFQKFPLLSESYENIVDRFLFSIPACETWATHC